MTDQEIQEQAEKYAEQFGIMDKPIESEKIKSTAIKHWLACAKWMQKQGEWISVETPPMKLNGVSELYVLASEDEDCLTVEKVFYDTKDNTYWIPFCKEQYFPKWYCYLPSPPKTK